MFKKFIKIIFFKEKKYFLFIFIAVCLSIFSYILSNNVILGVKEYLKQETKPLVWADIVISKDEQIDMKYLNDYIKYFKQAKTIEIDSTVFDKNNKPLLYEIVYHSDNYPFYDSFSYDTIHNDWFAVVDKFTYETFWDYIDVFDKKIKVKWIINQKPLWEISIYTNDKKIYLPIELLNKELNESNSRINYKVYLNFLSNYDEKIVQKIKEIWETKSYRIRTINDRQDSIGQITDRFYLFINWFNLVVFIITFFIIILSLESFFKKNKSNFWLLNIFGLSKYKIYLYSFFSVFFIFLFAYIISILLNYAVLEILHTRFSFFSFFNESYYKWLFIMIVLLIVWLFSPIYKIKKSKINDLLNDTSDFSNFSKKDYVIYLLLIFFWFFFINLISWVDIFYSMIFTLSSLIIVVIFYIFIKYLLQFNYSIISKKISSFYLFDAIRSTIKPGNVSFLIVFSSIISFLSIFIFFVFSWSFISYLNTLSDESNDMFVLNAQKDDLETINKYFDNDEVFEIISLRINKINWNSLKQFLNTDNVSREFSREFSSTTKQLDNKILEWLELKKWWVSVDIEFANRLWLKLWDKIWFTVAWLEKELVVTNFREALRNWTNPFFYFMLDKDDFSKYPKSYILSYKQSEKIQDLETILAKESKSNLTFINTKDIIAIVLDVADKILKVVYFSLFYIFVFSFISFLVSILFLKSFKEYKLKILHILWWIKRKLFIWVKFEYFYLILIWLVFSLVFWSIILFTIFMFIDYFSISLFYYFASILFLFIIFLLINLFIYFYGN